MLRYKGNLIWIFFLWHGWCCHHRRYSTQSESGRWNHCTTNFNQLLVQWRVRSTLVCHKSRYWIPLLFNLLSWLHAESSEIGEGVLEAALSCFTSMRLYKDILCQLISSFEVKKNFEYIPSLAFQALTSEPLLDKWVNEAFGDIFSVIRLFCYRLLSLYF
jgi:hypothetical protein